MGVVQTACKMCGSLRKYITESSGRRTEQTDLPGRIRTLITCTQQFEIAVVKPVDMTAQDESPQEPTTERTPHMSTLVEIS